MARKKLSEFTAKTLLFRSLGLPYTGVPLVISNGSEKSPCDLSVASLLREDNKDKRYVVKVDEGVKGRMKKGLVALKVKVEEIPRKVQELAEKGYSRFLLEEFVAHEPSSERYFSIERTREGNVIYYSNVGGIDIEQNQDKIHKEILSKENVSEIAKFLGLGKDMFGKITEFFDAEYISFLEVNPLVVLPSRHPREGENPSKKIPDQVGNDKFFFLDLAVEVDSAAEFFVQNSWTAGDYVEGGKKEKTIEEKNIIALQANSQASLKMEILNPNGSVFVMLFGGGGSIVVADEIYNQGMSNELANYGDYSGGPKEAETVIYVENLLKALLKSKAKKKVLLIAGTYANFTDVTVTFKGVIKAMEQVKQELKKQEIKVFVRRPGPNQKKGLAMIKEYLDKENINGGVWDSSMVISDVVLQAIDYLKK